MPWVHKDQRNNIIHSRRLCHWEKWALGFEPGTVISLILVFHCLGFSFISSTNKTVRLLACWQKPGSFVFSSSISPVSIQSFHVCLYVSPIESLSLAWCFWSSQTSPECQFRWGHTKGSQPRTAHCRNRLPLHRDSITGMVRCSLPSHALTAKVLSKTLHNELDCVLSPLSFQKNRHNLLILHTKSLVSMTV